MRNSTVFGFILAMAVPSPALAASCATVLAAPPGGGPSDGEFIMTTLDTRGVVNYARGVAVYSPAYWIRRPGLPPLPRKPRWMTGTQRPADLYRDIGRNFGNLGPPPAPEFVIRQVSISITDDQIPSLTVRFLDQNVTQQFRVTCSTGGLIHGTNPVMDVLIQLRRPIPVL